MALIRIAAAVLLSCPSGLAWGAGTDVLVLRNGGRVEGELLNPDESPRVHFVIKTPAGVEVTLAAAQVEQRLHPRPLEQQYEKLAPTYADTPEAQWELASWCGQNELTAQRKVHLERVIELDPDHQKARVALGYFRNPDTHQWVTHSELMQSRGMVQDPRTHKWMLPQELEILAGKERQDKAERQWMQKLARWQGELGGSRDAIAREGILTIKDPDAGRGLARLMGVDRNPRNRCLYIEAMSNIDSSGTRRFLAETAVSDAVEEVRLSCLDVLKKHKDPDVVSYFVSQLHSKDNHIVNRAAVGLSAMGDRSTIGPLIDALTTVHKFKVVTSNGNPNSMSAGFGKGGGTSGGGMSAGSAPQFVTRSLPNQQVLDALAMLTGVNYGYDKQQWKTWYASQRQQSVLDARRGQ